MLNNIFKIYIKILKNKKFTYYFALCVLFFITFVLSNPENNLVQGLRFLLDFPLIKLIIICKILFVSYYNLPLAMLNILSFAILYTVNSANTENFENIPNMVDKGKIHKYNKNFKEPKKLSSLVEEKEEEKIEKKETKEVKIPKKRKGYAVSTDFFKEKQEKNSKEKKEVEEINLDEEDDTIEKELKGRMTYEYKKLEEYDSSSSESSDSESSSSSSDSSDSEKEIEEVSMNKAREHMLNSLRNSLKKRYIND